MSQTINPARTVTIDEITEFPVTIGYGTGTVTLVAEVEFAHDLGDLMRCQGYYTQGDPEGERSILFLMAGQRFDLVD